MTPARPHRITLAQFDIRRWRRAELAPPILFVGFCNAAFSEVAWHVVADGFWPAISDGLAISVIIWAGFILGLRWTAQSDPATVSTRDLVVFSAALLTFLLPFSKPSWVGLSLLSAYLVATSKPHSSFRRGAATLAGVTVPMFWSKQVFWLLSDKLLPIDAAIVAAVTGLKHVGNAIELQGQVGRIFVAPGCSSVANLSMSLFCWFLFSQARRRSPTRNDVFWCIGMCLCVVAVNIGRMSLMAVYPQYYGLIHGPVGATTASALSMGITLILCHYGTRDEAHA